MLDAEALQALWLTLKLSTVVTLILLVIGTPIAWWLVQTSSWLKRPIGALVALPLVLPPLPRPLAALRTLFESGPRSPEDSGVWSLTQNSQSTH